MVCLDWRHQMTVHLMESVFKDQFTGQQTLRPAWKETITGVWLAGVLVWYWC